MEGKEAHEKKNFIYVSIYYTYIYIQFANVTAFVIAYIVSYIPNINASNDITMIYLCNLK